MTGELPATPLDVRAVIEAKKRGQELAAAQIADLVAGFTAGRVPRYQMAAFLMAVWFRDLTDGETAALTDSMLRSGAQLDTGDLGGPTADKHSTGGVGDKVSLLLAPLAAACGLRVPMLSGRGLGHTGGTLDKLEAIPGYRIHLDNAEFLGLVRRHGCAIVGQSDDIAPADGLIYALRDVTATVDCVPLITASIMSKKLAAGPRTIVIDLKCGAGAFMTDLDQARRLARALVAVGRSYDRRMAVLFTDMSQPLGVAVGHASEVREAFAALRPGGRREAPADLVELTEELTAAMVQVAGLAGDADAARDRVRAAWDAGEAWRCLRSWVEAQGGRLDWEADDLGLVVAPVAAELRAPAAGWLEVCDCRAVGLALADLGGARHRVEDVIDRAVGIDWLGKTGQPVERDQPVARLRGPAGAQLDAALRRLAAAIAVRPAPLAPPALVLDRWL
ncbi:MAG TPA: thymidine phosphorylase [Candidatus Krumholzibacteria bacterium]|nr:thymidine phosphorylase [Candidatus Krumholzibacteria bacterium]HPD71399.1 thymidine phosphorylase [Candidatus Krumholzibacteria bacterium]HRY38901.1 thymidine phosphorylase [Candidatus Krumholzibacteria bacterium]